MISKSSSFLSSIYIFIYSMRFCSYWLPNSRVLISKRSFALFCFYTTGSYFLFFFWWWSLVYSGFYYFFSFLPVAIFLSTGGFFRMYAVNLCLLSSYPVNGQESHFPVMMLLITIMCISGNLHLGQQMYFSMNLSKHFNISASGN